MSAVAVAGIAVVGEAVVGIRIAILGPTQASVDAARNTISFFFDGTNWLQTSASTGLV